jgi:hypothetical protein
MQYIVYDGESRDVRFEGECTITLKDDGILARQTGPDGPVLMKGSSASPNPRDSICYILRQRFLAEMTGGKVIVKRVSASIAFQVVVEKGS